MKVSFIATVYNEESTISYLLQSLLTQSKTPDEIVIVDGRSTDTTASVISNFIRSASSGQISNKQIKFKFIVKKGNRAVGRNEAIKNSDNEIIACSDSGCVLDKDWLRYITKPFEKKEVDVVAGYYRGKPENIFEKCLVPYALVMKDRVDSNNFLPAARSMSFKKNIWKKAGRFPQNLDFGEDYFFAKMLKKIKANIIFEKKALVYWRPRKNLLEVFSMFYNYAKGDSESRIFRFRVSLIFARYIICVVLIILFLIYKSYLILNTIYLILLIYIIWSIIKNYKYVKDTRAVVLLPLIQITSDFAVILGTINGLLTKKFKILIEGLFYISIIYSIILLNFRQLRYSFSPPKTTENEIIGYAQYFGYPLYFETIIFFVFILSPIVVFFGLSKIRKYKD